MTITRGFDSKIRVNGAVYYTREWEVDESTPSQECSNTEGTPASTIGVAAVGSEARTPGLGRVRVRITTASYDTLNNPFLAPISLATGIYVPVQIYVAGLAGPSWLFYSLEIEECSQNSSVPGLQPISFTGMTDGNWKRPFN